MTELFCDDPMVCCMLAVRAGYFCCAVVWLSTDHRQVVKLQLQAALGSLDIDGITVYLVTLRMPWMCL